MNYMNKIAEIFGVKIGERFEIKYPFIKKPFRPKYGDEYWYINKDGTFRRTSNDDAVFDYMAMYMGNCFRTRIEAEAHKDEIMAKFREVMGDDRA